MLDVATGAGHTALAFAPHVAKVTATDITEEMLAETRKLAESRGLANVKTLTANAEDLPFPDASFDLVVCRLPRIISPMWLLLRARHIGC